jgi:hypothetical protein
MFSAGAWKTTINAVLRIMKYCIETPNCGLLFKPKRKWTGRDFKFDLKGYSDSNYAAVPDNRQSVMLCEVFLEDCCILAKSKQMPFVTLSVTEAELAAAVECAQDLMYAMHVLENMGLYVIKPMPLYVDNKAAVNMVQNWISGGRTRHTAVRLNFLRLVMTTLLTLVQKIPIVQPLNVMEFVCMERMSTIESLCNPCSRPIQSGRVLQELLWTWTTSSRELVQTCFWSRY